MQRAIPAAALASLIATSAAIAGTPPLWLTHRPSHAPTTDQRDSSPASQRGDRNRSGTPSAQQETNDHGGGQRGFDRDRNRGTVDGRRNDGDRGQPDRGERRQLTDPRPDLNLEHSNRDRDRNRNDDRDHGGDRNWHGEADRNRHDHDRDGDRDWRGDRHWSAGRDWDRGDGAHWRDDHGCEWHHDHGWYDRYRVDHFRHYRGRYFAHQRFSIGFYDAPFGYSSRIWVVGDWLPSTYYFDDRYVVDDYWRFDLYDPPFRCRWIRVGADALLIDIDSGEVVDAIYSLYW